MKTSSRRFLSRHLKFHTLGERLKTASLKKLFLLFSVAVLLAGGAAAVRGQSALDGFDPNANGAVRVVVVNRTARFLSAAILPRSRPTAERRSRATALPG